MLGFGALNIEHAVRLCACHISKQQTIIRFRINPNSEIRIECFRAEIAFYLSYTYSTLNMLNAHSLAYQTYSVFSVLHIEQKTTAITANHVS